MLFEPSPLGYTLSGILRELHDEERAQGLRMDESEHGTIMQASTSTTCSTAVRGSCTKSPRGGSSGSESPSGDSSDRGQGVTTLMLRNIPCRCTEAEVLEAIAEVGFADAAQFLYMPVKSQSGKNVGYAFVGFGDVETADAFKLRVDGINMFKHRKTEKVVSIVPAHIQGLNETLQRFGKSSKGPVLLQSQDSSIPLPPGLEDALPRCRKNSKGPVILQSQDSLTSLPPGLEETLPRCRKNSKGPLILQPQDSLISFPPGLEETLPRFGMGSRGPLLLQPQDSAAPPWESELRTSSDLGISQGRTGSESSHHSGV